MMLEGSFYDRPVPARASSFILMAGPLLILRLAFVDEDLVEEVGDEA
jgi:hypothetical protein